MAWIEGEKVGGYILGKQLGQGGMATVYLAEHPELDRQVAIKVMHQNFLEDDGFVARFKREAQIVARLTHPHIVPVYDYNEHQGQPYLVMKYVPGWTLKKQLIKDPPDLDGVLSIMTAIGDAITYAHSQDVLHRDIKPSNIVIDRNGIPYLTDFGLARLASSGESTMSADMLLGTPHYISPEQARGAKDLDSRTDIYSFGIVLYELLVGKVPFTGESAFSIIHDHIYSLLPPPTQINPELPLAVETVLYKSLEKQPSERYETANALIQDLTIAIKNSDLIALNPKRSDMAEASLAQFRADMEDQPTITPYVGVGSPFASDSGSVRQAKMIAKQKPFYDQDRFWLISGCGSLLVIVFLSLGVLLSIAGNIQELAALSLDNEDVIDMRLGLFDDIRDLVESYSAYDVMMTSDEGIPVLDIPLVDIDDISEDADDPITALIRARSLYESGDNVTAREQIIGNIPTQDRLSIVYLMSAANIANQAQDYEAAIVFWVATTEASLSDEDLFRTVRPVTLSRIYDTNSSERVFDLETIIETIIDDNSLNQTVMMQLADSDFASFAILSNIARNDTRAGNNIALERIPEDSIIDAEFTLLRADLQISLGNTDEALIVLNDILDMRDVPPWVVNRVQDLRTELE